MNDFNFIIYSSLLKTLKNQGFSFLTVSNYFQDKSLNTPTILLRHDVEEKYSIALKFAQIQQEFGIRGTFYFRLIPKISKEKIIREIAGLGHEIGYHYDDLSHCKGDYEKAIRRFQDNLAFLREIAPVTSITMEGAPLSKYDNRLLWNKFNYRDFGIIAEPYFDLDFSRIFYLTDTGRRWDGWRVSIRDKVPQQNEWVKQGLVFHSTSDIINAAIEGRLPNKIMMTFHPQRWSDKPLPWLRELVFQKFKNQAKRLIILAKSK